MSSEMDELEAQGDRDRGVYDLTDFHSGADHKATPASPPSIKGLDLSRAMRRCTRSHPHPTRTHTLVRTVSRSHLLSLYV
jgi:hypothetical protein